LFSSYFYDYKVLPARTKELSFDTPTLSTEDRPVSIRRKCVASAHHIELSIFIGWMPGEAAERT
jgi:hypothetical protein